MKAIKRLFEMQRSELTGFVGYLAVAALFRASNNSVQTTAPLLGRQILDLSTSSVGLAIAFSGVSAVLTAFLVSVRKKKLKSAPRLALIATGVSILLVISKDPAGFFLGYIALGISGGLMYPSLATIGSHLDGVSPSRGVAAYTFALSASLAVGPLLESVLLRLWPGSLGVAMGSFLPFILLALWLTKKADVGLMADPPEEVISKRKVTVKELMRVRGFRIAIYAQLIYSFPFVAAVSFGALAAHFIYHISASSTQLAFTVLFVASFASRGVIVLYPHRLKLRAMVVFASSLSIVAIIIFATGSSPTDLFISFALLGIPHGLIYPISLNLARNSVDEGELDRANSLLSAAAGSANIISPFILGYFADFFGLRWMIILVLIPTIAFAIPSIRREGYQTAVTS